MPGPFCDTSLLDLFRRNALLAAQKATDPLIKRQYLDVAQGYADTAADRREGKPPGTPFKAVTQMPWRSVPLWVTNDQ